MQKYGWRFFPVIPTGAGQTYQTRAGALGNYGVVNLDCKKQILLWACPTPTKGNCWCCLQTAGGVPTPHGSAVESHGVSLFFPAAFSYWACAHSNVLALYTFTNPDTVHWGSNVLFEFFISIKFLSFDVKKKKKRMREKWIKNYIFILAFLFVPKWNGTIHMWQKLWDLKHLRGFFWCLMLNVLNIWHLAHLLDAFSTLKIIQPNHISLDCAMQYYQWVIYNKRDNCSKFIYCLTWNYFIYP